MILYANNILVDHIILNELFLIVYPSFLLKYINWVKNIEEWLKIKLIQCKYSKY